MKAIYSEVPKENCIRREEFVSHQLKLENKLDRLMEFMMKQGGN